MPRPLCAPALLAAFVVSSTPALAQAEEPKAEKSLAGPLVTLAEEHRDAKRYQETLVALRTAWSEEQRPEIGCNRGLVAGRLGLFQEAAEFLDRCLREPPPGLSDNQKTILRAQLAMARQEVASLTIAVNVPGADVLVNGRIMGRSPLAAELFVERGTYEIAANLAGRTVSDKVTVGKGDHRSVSLRIPPVFTELPSTEESASSKPMNLRPLMIIGGVTAGVGLATSAGMFIASRVYYGRADDSLRTALRLSPASCAAPGRPEVCEVYRSQSDQAGTFQDFAVSSAIVAGVAGGATIVFAVINHNRLKSAAIAQALTGTFVW